MLEKLKSRKLWVSLISAAYFAVHGDMNQAAAVIMAYVGVQGTTDAICAMKKDK